MDRVIFAIHHIEYTFGAIDKFMGEEYLNESRNTIY